MWLLGDWEGLTLILGAYSLGLLLIRSIIACTTFVSLKISLNVVMLRVWCLGEGVWVEDDEGRLGDEVADEGLDLGLGGGVGGNLMIFEGEIGSVMASEM